MIYISTTEKIYNSLRSRDIKVFDLEAYFACDIVKRNYGISSIHIIRNNVQFHILNEKKFALKVVKYGF